jgi:hypothetical protein
MPNKLVSETIDGRILRLIGLEDVFDLDYDTYLTELKDAMVRGSFGKNKIPDEELALLANERKRIRGKKGRFKPKKQKITADKVATTKLLRGTKKTALLSPSVSEISKIETSPEILKPLESISNTLSGLLKLRKKEGENQKKENERDKRAKKEEGLEGFKKGISAISGAAKKMLAPFQSIIDRIWKFIFFTLLGRAFTQLMDWLKDPANAKKIATLGRFLKDWWPALLGAYFMPFKGFILKTIAQLAGFAAKFLLFNPVGQTIAGATAAGVAGSYLESELRKNDEILLQRRIKESEEKGKPLSKEQIEKIRLENLQKRIGDVTGSNNPSNPGLAGGGLIDSNTGVRIAGAGPDTQLTALQPGEVVMNRSAVKAVGADTLLALNARYGGANANKPKYSNNIRTAFNGGIISSPLVGFSQGGQVGGSPKLINQKSIAIYNRLIKGGLTPIAAAGIVSNIGVETGYSYNPSTLQEGGGPGRGLVQWEKGGRYDTDNINLLSFAKKNKKPWTDLNTQVDFILHELNKHPEYMQVRKMINSAKSVPEATKIFLEKYEKAGVAHFDRRLEVGKQLLNSGLGKPKPKEKPKSKSKVKSSNILSNFASFMPTALPFVGGGLIKENTGMDIPGATADRQLTALQPGEYVLPVDSVNNLGVSLLDKLVAATDSNSNAAKLGKRSIQLYTPQPLRRTGKSSLITLPPITQSAMGGVANQASTKQVPSFSASSPSGGAERAMNASIYGIVG